MKIDDDAYFGSDIHHNTKWWYISLCFFVDLKWYALIISIPLKHISKTKMSWHNINPYKGFNHEEAVVKTTK